MKYKKMYMAIDLIGIFAVVLIGLKVIFLEPRCFSLLDGYTTVLPVVFTKIIDLINLYS